jgi:DNA-binding protein
LKTLQKLKKIATNQTNNNRNEVLMKAKALALIEAVSFYGGVRHKRYKRIAGNSSKKKSQTLLEFGI